MLLHGIQLAAFQCRFLTTIHISTVYISTVSIFQRQVPSTTIYFNYYFCSIVTFIQWQLCQCFGSGSRRMGLDPDPDPDVCDRIRIQKFRKVGSGSGQK
jgi:hypothetical protein